MTSPSHHTTKSPCSPRASPTARCPCRGRRRALVDVADRHDGRAGRRRRGRCRRCCSRRARSARRRHRWRSISSTATGARASRSSPPRRGTGCTSTPSARPSAATCDPLDPVRPPTSTAHRPTPRPDASVGRALYGVVNASPDSLHTGSIATPPRRSPGASCWRGRRPRPRRPGVDRRRHRRRLASSGPARGDRAGARRPRRRTSASTVGARGRRRRSRRGHRDQRRRRHADGAMWQVAADFDVPIVVPFLGPEPTAMDLVRNDPSPRSSSSSTPGSPTPTARPAPPLHPRPGTGFAPPAWPWEERYHYQKRVYTPSTRCAGSSCRCTSPCRGRRPPSTTSCSRSSSASSRVRARHLPGPAVQATPRCGGQAPPRVHTGRRWRRVHPGGHRSGATSASGASTKRRSATGWGIVSSARRSRPRRRTGRRRRASAAPADPLAQRRPRSLAAADEGERVGGVRDGHHVEVRALAIGSADGIGLEHLRLATTPPSPSTGARGSPRGRRRWSRGRRSPGARTGPTSSRRVRRIVAAWSRRAPRSADAAWSRVSSTASARSNPTTTSDPRSARRSSRRPWTPAPHPRRAR